MAQPQVSMPTMCRAFLDWRPAAGAPRLLGRRLASFSTPCLLCWVCLFGALNLAPALRLSEGGSEAAKGEACEEEFGLAVDLFGRTRRCPRIDASLRAQAAAHVNLPAAESFPHQHGRGGHRVAELALRNGCGAVLRC